MPELPEVENVVSTLRENILGQKILAVKVEDKGVNALGGISPAAFVGSLTNRIFTEISRVGKFIIIRFESPTQQALIVHLRMTGRFLYVGKNGREALAPKVLVNDGESEVAIDPYIRFHFKLEDGDLYFSDKRRFGTMHLTDGVGEYKGIVRLGPDALTDGFTVDYLKHALANKNKPIYSALLDQQIVAGLGNIYVCEVLARAGIHPLTSAKLLTVEQIQLIHKYTVEVLRSAVESQGTSFSDYLNARGEKGSFQEKLWVYGKKTTVIDGKDYQVSKVKIGGRTAFFVESLQKMLQ